MTVADGAFHQVFRTPIAVDELLAGRHAADWGALLGARDRNCAGPSRECIQYGCIQSTAIADQH